VDSAEIPDERSLWEVAVMTRYRRAGTVLLSVVMCLVAGGARSAARAQGAPGGDGAEGVPGAASTARSLSPYFLLEGEGTSAETFPLKSTEVTANVDGVIADVVVAQVYANEGSVPINARYLFPASTRASVHGMRIKIGDQAVVAKIQEKQEAKRTFETAKAAGKSASLLEQHRPNVFQMSVANILPGDRVEVELRYSELLVPEEGIYQFVYPTVVGPRYSNRPEASAPESSQWVKTPYLREKEDPPGVFDLHVTLSTGVPLREVRCPTHDVKVDWEGQALARVSLAQGNGFGGNRDFILSYRLAGDQIQSGLLLYQGEDENFFLLMVQPPERVSVSQVPPREYVFVLDVSGSMWGFPLDTAKTLIRDLIGHLRETDLFDVVLFSGDSQVLSPASLPATPGNIRRAMSLIEQQRGGGGTELLPALGTALSLPRHAEFSRTVVVITDGFIEADRDVFSLIEQNLNRTNFFCFGIGSSVNRYLAEGIARAGMGEPFVVTNPSEAPAAADRFRRYVDSPLLTGVQVTTRGFGAYDVEPPALPDLSARRPVVLFGKWRGERTGEIEVTGRDAAGKYSRVFRVSDTKPLAANGALRYLWAREKIARLSDFSSGAEDAATAQQITSLGLTYSLLTRHTSFVAVLEQVRNPDGTAKDVDHPLPLPQGVSNHAVGGGDFAAGPEPEIGLLLAVVGLLLAAVAPRRRRRPLPSR
jgi:Ca-activated chloride channel family protein